MPLFRLCLFILAVTHLTGCAFGQRVDYTQAVPALALSSDQSVAVVVIDERPYVVSGNKDSKYVGTVRGGYYNPFNMNTHSGLPLAMDLQKAVVTALNRASITARDQNYPSTKASLPDQRLLVLRVREWKSDTYMRARFDYDLTTSIYDNQGTQLMTRDSKWTGQINNYLEAGGAALGKALNGSDVDDALDVQAGANVEVEPKQASASAPATSAYDQCMRRVMRISDKALRLQAIPACDGAK